MNKDNMKLIELLNPTAFNLSMAGIGFQDGYENYILVVFKDKTIKFNKTYKSLRNAKIGFAKVTEFEEIFERYFLVKPGKYKEFVKERNNKSLEAEHDDQLKRNIETLRN